MKAGEISRKLLALRPALLSDALGKSGATDHDMRCWSANCRMAGPATTLRVHTADILMVGKALSLCPKDYVLVIDGQGELNTALWGAITTECARLKGVRGVVIDGAIRDVGQIRRDRLPVFARAAVPNAGGAEYRGEVNVAIQCGGVVVHPGDWIVSDEDGIVVVPSERILDVIAAAEKLRDVEKQIYQRVKRGEDLAALLRYDELIEAKTAAGGLPQMRFSSKRSSARR
jgi:3-hexulose-6-phosphate synthase/6-phospho-3-hexuloisomerase